MVMRYLSAYDCALAEKIQSGYLIYWGTVADRAPEEQAALQRLVELRVLLLHDDGFLHVDKHSLERMTQPDFPRATA